MDFKNESSAQDKHDCSIIRKLEKTECPFTWHMDAITKDINIQHTDYDDEECLPLMNLVYDITTLFVNTNANEDFQTIMKTLENCDDSIAALKEKNDPQISIDAAYHVLLATQCFVFHKLGMKDKLEKVFAEIKSVDIMNEKEKSTLLACKSMAWYRSNRIGIKESETFIREAIHKNSKCALWYFVLGINLRRKRRFSSISLPANEEEINSFSKAYKMSKHPVYGIFMAQAYREARNYKQALQMYKRIFQDNPESTTILLRLALGFIQNSKFEFAKKCLDKVEEKYPMNMNSLYIHYKGIYHYKKNKYKEAANFLKQAFMAGSDKIGAEKQYLHCMVRIHESFDTTKYLQQMIDKYKTLPEQQIQLLILDLAFSYWKKDNNIEQTLKYLLQAMSIDPKAPCITNYYSNIVPVEDKNVFRMLKRELLPMVEIQLSKFDDDTIKVVESLKKYCDEYYHSEFKSMENSFSRHKLKK